MDRKAARGKYLIPFALLFGGAYESEDGDMAQGRQQGLPDKRPPLPTGTLLCRRYEIERLIEQRACGLCYRALDTLERRAVNVIEYYPAELCARASESPVLAPCDKRCGERFFAGSEAFYNQYTALTQAVGSRNLLPVYDAFFDNGTAYAVVACAEGISLMAYLKEKKRTLTNGEFAFLLSALSDALLVIHSLSIRHEGIGLGTILLTAGGGAMLTGYGAADARVNGATSDDIEMLGQALYEAYTGKRFGGQWRFPPDSVETVRGVLRRMLTSDPALRFDGVFDLLHAAAGLDIPQEPPEIYARDVRALRRANAAAAVAPALDPAPGAPYAAEQSDSDHADAHASDDTAKSIPRWVLPMLAGVLLLLVAALLIALINR